MAKMREIMSIELRAAARLEGTRLEKDSSDRIVARLTEQRLWTR